MQRSGDNLSMDSMAKESRTNVFDFDRASLERFFEEELGEKKFRAQEYFFKEARRTAKAREHERAMTFEPHVPK